MVYRKFCDTPHTISWTSKCQCGAETKYQHTFEIGKIYPGALCMWEVVEGSSIMSGQYITSSSKQEGDAGGQMLMKCKACGTMTQETLPPLGTLWVVTIRGENFIGNAYLVNQKERKRMLQEIAEIESKKSLTDFFYHSDKKAGDMFHAEWVKKDIKIYDSRKNKGLLTEEEMHLER